MTLSELGAELRAERQRQGLSLYRTGVKARVHPNSVHLAERGAASPEMMERIAKALGLEVEAPSP